MRIATLKIEFDNEISPRELPLLRGAIIKAVGYDDLFHNHSVDGVQYRYPLIQYKRIHRCAAVYAVDKGVEHIGKLLNMPVLKFSLGGREERFGIKRVVPSFYRIQCWDTMFSYYLRNWIALNQENYNAYLEIETLALRLQFLEKILVGNILSMCKGLNINIESEIVCGITELYGTRTCLYKGTRMLTFDIEFQTNVSLPDYIGLGKGVSLGHGVVVHKTEKKTNKTSSDE